MKILPRPASSSSSSPPASSSSSPSASLSLFISPEFILIGIKLTSIVLTVRFCNLSAINAQTEGDTGYDYGDVNEYFDESAVGPSFDIPIANVTVVEGQSAVLPCSIDHLGNYKVVWLGRDALQLTYEDIRTTDDTRFAVVRPTSKEWNLQIRDIRSTDAGQYACTVSTKYVVNKIIMLNVQVPASIVDELSTDRVKVKEGEALTMYCNATGSPEPVVTWRRLQMKDSSNCSVFPPDVLLFIGPRFVIDNISRYCGDVYECAADNGVRAPATRRIHVTVQFAPKIVLPNRRLGQALGRLTILECYITARPQMANKWSRNNPKNPLHSQLTSRHRVDVIEDGPDSVVLTLTISKIGPEDYGDYACVADNQLGQDQQTMTVFQLEVRSTVARGATAPTTMRQISNSNHHLPVLEQDPSKNDSSVIYGRLEPVSGKGWNIGFALSGCRFHVSYILCCRWINVIFLAIFLRL